MGTIGSGDDFMKNDYEPKHMRNNSDRGEGAPDNASASEAVINPVHPAAVPLPDSDDSAQYIPLPDGRNVAANGAIVRNPLADQPEIKPDYEYTPEKEDLNLLIM